MSAPGAPGAIRLFTERFPPPGLGRERDGERRSPRPGGREPWGERLGAREPEIDPKQNHKKANQSKAVETQIDIKIFREGKRKITFKRATIRLKDNFSNKKLKLEDNK